MKVRPKDYVVRRGQRIDLSEWPTRGPAIAAKEAAALRAEHHARLDRMQRMLYAHDRHSLLVIFQAMDAAGKDSAIRHVMSGVNPQGCHVATFKHPSGDELEHDFLWRAAARLPERGEIGIFNRSYYEEVLIVRVHKGLLAAEKLPKQPSGKALWKGRYKSIRDFEHHLHRGGTRIVKVFLHLSKEEQRRRFLARIDEPHKHWKFSLDDLRERAAWPAYMRAYAECLRHTSTAKAPWYVVPADDKETAQLIISGLILHTLDGMDLRYPRMAQRGKELAAIRRQLGAPANRRAASRGRTRRARQSRRRG